MAFNQESLAQSPDERNGQVNPKKAVKCRVTIANMIRLGDWLRNNYEKIAAARLHLYEVAEIATQELGFPVAPTTVVKALKACSLSRWVSRVDEDTVNKRTRTKRMNRLNRQYGAGLNVLALAVRSLYARLGEKLSEEFEREFPTTGG